MEWFVQFTVPETKMGLSGEFTAIKRYAEAELPSVLDIIKRCLEKSGRVEFVPTDNKLSRRFDFYAVSALGKTYLRVNCPAEVYVRPIEKLLLTKANIYAVLRQCLQGGVKKV